MTRRAGTKVGMTPEAAAAVLGVNLETLDADRLAVGFRAAAMKHHPDSANNANPNDPPRTMDELRAARATLAKFLQTTRASSKQCPACFGNKTVTLHGTFVSITCPRCGGRGELVK